MQFRTRPDGFDAIRKRIVIMMIILMLAIMGIVIGPGLLYGDEDSMQTSLITLVFLSLVSGFAVAFTLKKQKEQFLSIILTIDGDVVSCQSHVLPTITIRAGEGIRIVRALDGSLMISGSHLAQIAVPSQMENYDTMIAMLGKLTTITESRKKYTTLSLVVLAATLGLLAVDFLVKDQMINIVSYSITVAGLAIALVVGLRSPLLEPRVKRLLWFGLIPLISFIFILISLIKPE